MRYIEIRVVFLEKRNIARYLLILRYRQLQSAPVEDFAVARFPPKSTAWGYKQMAFFGGWGECVFAHRNNRALAGSSCALSATPDLSGRSLEAAFEGTDIRHADAN